MRAHRNTPFSVVVSNAIVHIAAMLVPCEQRPDWKREWLGEIWHHWQFLAHAQAWNRRESIRLIRNCFGAFHDAAWHLVSEERSGERLREWIRSPWSCFAGFAALLLTLALLTSGFPATRQLLASRAHDASGQVLFVWLHPAIGGGDRGLPPDVVPAWAKYSQLLQNAAAFNVSHARFDSGRHASLTPLVIVTQPQLFDVLRVRPKLGQLPAESAVVLDHDTWASVFHSARNAIGSRVRVGREFFPVAAVLPVNFHFLSRHPSVYLVEPEITDARVMVIARMRPGAVKGGLDRELTRIAEDKCYYFFRGQLRLGFLESAILAPLGSFAIAIFASGLIVLAVCGVRVRHVRAALRRENRSLALRRGTFFFAKTALALALVFVAGLEWSRSESSLLFATRDPASGPFLVWLYIAGAMGIFFWSVADQRARCRVCQRWLCFPVRIGCPGCLLLDWAGTELLCTEGHGVLHVPHMAPSWDEQPEHWISMDESWRNLFLDTK